MKKLVWGILAVIGLLLLIIIKPFTLIFGRIRNIFEQKKIKKQFNRVITLFENKKYDSALYEAKLLSEEIASYWGVNNEYFYHSKKTISDILFESNNFERAVPALLDCLEIIRKYNLNDSEKIKLLYNLSFSYQNLGRYFRARTYYEELFSLKEFSSDHPKYFYARVNLSRVYFELNLLNQSEETSLFVKDYFERKGLTKEKHYLWALVNLIDTRNNKNDIGGAAEIIDRALPFIEKNFPDDDLYGSVLYSVSNHYVLLKQYESAEFYIRKGIDYCSNNLSDPDSLSQFKSLMAIVKSEQSNYAESLDLMVETSDTCNSKSLPDEKDYFQTQYFLASTYLKINDKLNAKKHYTNVLNSLVKYISNISEASENDRLQFISSWWGINDNLLSFAVSVFDEDKDFIRRIFNYRVLVRGILSDNSKGYRNETDYFSVISANISGDEAVVEMIRFKQIETNEILYLILIITSETKTHPDYVLLSASKLEGKFYKYYREIDLYQSNGFEFCQSLLAVS